MSRFFVENFGCRATQADGAAIERQMLERGLARAEAASQAQLVVLNTCTVTASADQDVRSSIRRIRRENPECQIMVTGCYAQRAPEEIAAIPGVTWVVGNSHKHAIGEVACGSSSVGFVGLDSIASVSGQILVGDIFAHTELMAAPVFEADTASEKTRPNLKVQDGCNNRCSFCIIPSVRGRSRSLALDEVVREVNALVTQGYRELVISGINLGRWGRDLRRSDTFAALLRAILEQTDLERLRISSVEPMDWTDEVIELVSSSGRIAKHAHVPMQSGSDRILRLMHRKYRPWHYAEKIRKIRAAMPTAAIGADVMVGFPGETDADFEKTRMLIDELPFTYLHVFTYSPRPGTPAAVMPNHVPGPVTRRRNRILRELAAAKKREFQERFIGRELEAITLTTFNGSHTECLTDNYQKLWLEGQHEPNQWARARVEQVEKDSLVGTRSDSGTFAND
ncbi:MAG TPA: tRNA (N(6)-L-threonylcarbamoyladenosine(37)-C(2))-methylthiotransferase MtaB [Terriglobales bacterium]|nr:tRNA (N(6)-L-threonylcarbamoyladenosine(37)-C(2))-methylthiotransferase MtaB [Terriglobales bacterium]